jgi:ribokinase
MTFIILGNITADEFMLAPVWPEPGRTIVVGPPVRDLGGKGANQAIVLNRAGARVRLVAAIGHDEAGAWMERGLAAEGLSSGDLIRLPLPSDRSLIFVAPSGENAIASVIACSEALTEAQARAALAEAGAGDALVLQGNLALATTRAACLAAREAGLPVLFNPSPMREGFFDLLPMIDLLVVNEGEAIELAGPLAPEARLRRLRDCGAGTVVMTLGARGAMALGRFGAATVPAESVEAIDTTGAGDTFMAVLAAALFERHLPIEAGLRVAAAAAAITVGRRGTLSAFPSAAELAALFGGA